MCSLHICTTGLVHVGNGRQQTLCLYCHCMLYRLLQLSDTRSVQMLHVGYIYMLYRALVSSSYCSVVVKYMYVHMWWEYIQCTCRTLLSVHCTVGMVCSDLFRGWRTRGFPPWLATHPWKFPTIIIVFKFLSFWFINVVSEATRSSLRCYRKFSWGSMPPDPHVTTSYNFSPLTKNPI